MKDGEDENKKTDPAVNKLVSRGLDVATHGNWSRAKKMPVIGKPLQGVEKNLANRIKPKHVNPLNHERPKMGVTPPGNNNSNQANSPSETSQNTQAQQSNKEGIARRLQKAYANRPKNLFDLLNRNNKKKKPTEESSTNTNDEEPDTSIVSDEEESPAAKIKKIRRLVTLLSTGFGLFFTFVIVVGLLSLFGVNIAQAIPAVGPMTYNTSSYQPVYEEGTSQRKEEEAYYEKLSKYQKDKGVKISYIHAVLLYKDMMTESDKEEYSIDFKEYSKKADEIYELMKSEDSKNIDYEKYGTFYNNLKDSDFFNEYYRKLIIEEGDNGATKLLDKIFDLASDIDKVEITDDTTITEETKVTVKPSTQPTQTKTPETKTKTMTINEYISGSIYANTDKVSNSEMVKAYTVAYSTNIVAENKKLSITSNEATMDNKVCSIKVGCSYDIYDKLVDGPGIQSSKNTVFYKGNYYYKKPLTEEEITNLNKDISSVMGNVLTTKDGAYPSLDTSVIGGLGDGENDYKKILSSSYGNELKYKNIGEDSYDDGIDYGSGETKLVNLKALGYFYEQKDYSKNRFCGIPGYTIGGSGCGVTAMAMIASYFEKNSYYNPVVMNDYSTKWKTCGGGQTGTKIEFFRKMSKELKYNYIPLNKGSNVTPSMVINHLKSGHLVIARMGQGKFTKGGHYIVLAGYRSVKNEAQVYVYDPNNRNNSKNRGTGNGWYSFNKVILKEAKNFYIIYK